METLKRLPFKARKAVFEKLEEIADVASMSPKERELYDNSVKVYRDYLVTMDAAEKEGIKKGMEEGLKKGREEALNIEKEREKVAIIVSEPGSQVAERSTYILIYNKIE